MPNRLIVPVCDNDKHEIRMKSVASTTRKPLLLFLLFGLLLLRAEQRTSLLESAPATPNPVVWLLPNLIVSEIPFWSLLEFPRDYILKFQIAKG